jgi:retron-type reverse transcriptase
VFTFKQFALFLPAAGNRNRNGGAQNNVGANGNYWSSTPTSTNSYNLNFNSTSINAANTNNRSNGLTVRCIAELNTQIRLLEQDFYTMDPLKLDLFQAYYDARRNKRNTINQLRFEINYEHHLLKLYEELVNRTYEINKSITFIVNHPVKREIFAADFRDRIIHHLIYNYINPVVDKQLIDSCYSCRPGRGTLYGIRQMYEFMTACSQNYTRGCYVLKLDIRGYFMSINKHLLWKKLLVMLQQPEIDELPGISREMLLWLIDLVLWNDPTQSCIIKGKNSDWDDLPVTKSLFNNPKDCGLPIGNLTSQLFSNVYLHEFDSYIKHELGVEYYGRYVDDFVLIHPDKEFLLQAKTKIQAYLTAHCALTIHPNKVYLQYYQKGFSFLGAYIKYGYLKTIPHQSMVYIAHTKPEQPLAL